jgi:hypothetical protein
MDSSTGYHYHAAGRLIKEYSAKDANGVPSFYLSYQYAKSHSASGTGALLTTVTTQVARDNECVASSKTRQYTRGLIAANAINGEARPLICNAGNGDETIHGPFNLPLKVGNNGEAAIFFTYDTKGRVIESSGYTQQYLRAWPRPALAFAASITAAEWHPIWNFPIRTDQDAIISEYDYDSKGMKSREITKFLTREDKRLKFTGELSTTRPQRRFEYTYTNNGLESRYISHETPKSGAEKVTYQRARTYDALGNVTSEKIDAKPVEVFLEHAPSGRVLEGIGSDGYRNRVDLEPRGKVIAHHHGNAAAKRHPTEGGIINSPKGTTSRILYSPTGKVLQYDDAKERERTKYKPDGCLDSVTPLSSEDIEMLQKPDSKINK